MPKTNTRHIIGFSIAGLAAFFVDAGVYLAFAGLGFAPALARVPSIFAAILMTWGFNRRWTFRTSEPASLSEFVKYVGAMGIGLVVNYSVFLGLMTFSATARAFPLMPLAVATVAAMALNFLSARYLLDR